MPTIWKTMRQVKLCLLILYLIAFSAGPARASYDYHFDKREPKMGQFESEVTGKLTRGIVNTLYGWSELFRTPIDMSSWPNYGPLRTIFLGIPYGAARAVTRSVVGVYEIATFFAPQPPIMQPIEGNIV